MEEHKQSRLGEPSVATIAKQVERQQQQQSPLQQTVSAAAPPPVTLSAAPPPVKRRRSPAPPPLGPRSGSPAPSINGNNDSLYPPPSAGLMSPTVNIVSPNSVGSAYSNNPRLDTTTPLYSGRPNPGNYPSFSGMRPPRTPASTLQQQQTTTPVSAPMPGPSLASPLPRSPMSAAPFRMRERSDSFRDREVSGSESYSAREATFRDRPPRSARASPVPRSPVPLPPRSANRPNTPLGGGPRTPVAVAQHEGMI